MSSPRRRSTLLVLLSCAGGLGASCGKTITVPVADPHTRPDVVLDVHFPQGPILNISPTGNTPTVPAHLNGNDEISLVALCTDDQSGCRNIEIFADATLTNADGSVVSAVAGPAVAANPDPNAVPGGTASRKRNASIKLNVPQLRGTSAVLKLDVSARATNSHGEMWNTKKVALHWTQQAPLKVPPCDWLNPLGTPSDPPVVIDSRVVTVAIQDAKATNPGRTSFQIGILDPPPPNTHHVWRIDVEEAAIPPTSAIFKLVDQTGWIRDMVSVDGRNCAAAGTVWFVPANSSSGDLTIDSSTTTTIVLRKPNTGIGASGMRYVAVWNEATFWPAFGGKKTTITWVPFP